MRSVCTIWQSWPVCSLRWREKAGRKNLTQPLDWSPSISNTHWGLNRVHFLSLSFSIIMILWVSWSLHRRSDSLKRVMVFPGSSSPSLLVQTDSSVSLLHTDKLKMAWTTNTSTLLRCLKNTDPKPVQAIVHYIDLFLGVFLVCQHLGISTKMEFQT